MTPAWFLSVARTVAQVVIGYLVTKLAAQGISIPLEAQNWLVETLLVGLFVGLWTAGVRWLETRIGNELWKRAARKLAVVLMFGLRSQPIYRPPEAVQNAPMMLGPTLGELRERWSTTTPPDLGNPPEIR